MLKADESLLLLIDIQEKLVRACAHKETIVKKASIIGEAARILSIPTVVTEQYPQGLGATSDQLKEVLGGDTVYIEKTNFSALKEEGFKEKLALYGRKQIILGGIEAHICVYQTCAELLAQGYEVYIAKEITSSRNEYEYETGLELMKSDGAKLTCVETVLFEWLGGSKHPNFKEVQKLIK